MILVGVGGYHIFEHAVGAVFVYVRLYSGRARLTRAGVYEHLGIADLYQSAVARIFVAELYKMYGEVSRGYVGLAALVRTGSRISAHRAFILRVESMRGAV